MDNIHCPLAADADGDELVVQFDAGEVLTVVNPAGWLFTAEVFRIAEASRVVWRWYYYGRPKSRDSLFTIEHRLDADGRIAAWSDVDWYSPSFAPTSSAPAVELL
jgi:hypothetical protein